MHTLKLLLLISMIILINSCAKKSDFKIKAVMMGFEIDNDSRDYIFSDEPESSLTSNNSKYSIQSKAIYDEQGKFNMLHVFKSEGMVTYSRADVQRDTTLLDYFEITLESNMDFDHKKRVVINLNDTIPVKVDREKNLLVEINRSKFLRLYEFY